jgi:hypothetical protein
VNDEDDWLDGILRGVDLPEVADDPSDLVAPRFDDLDWEGFE